MLSKTVVKARPSVLWCYKKDLGFSSHRKKRMKSLQKKIKSGKIDVNEDDPFELFVISTNIRYCYYNETHKILGNTYGMCILQVCIHCVLYYINFSSFSSLVHQLYSNIASYNFRILKQLHQIYWHVLLKPSRAVESLYFCCNL